jgi:hypothetical protein
MQVRTADDRDNNQFTVVISGDSSRNVLAKMRGVRVNILSPRSPIQWVDVTIRGSKLIAKGRDKEGTLVALYIDKVACGVAGPDTENTATILALLGRGSKEKLYKRLLEDRPIGSTYDFSS